LLKNLSPLLSGALLSALDAMHDGATLTLVGSGYPEDKITTPVVHLGDDVTTEAAAEAILSVFPLDQDDASPIVFLDLAWIRIGRVHPVVVLAPQRIVVETELPRMSETVRQREHAGPRTPRVHGRPLEAHIHVNTMTRTDH
jgi:L-fucose mutarotase